MTISEINKTNPNMKAAALEMIIVWVFTFICSVYAFFYILDYAAVLKIKNNIDSISSFAVNYIAIEGEDDISDSLNEIAHNSIDTIDGNAADLCETTADGNYQVIFTTILDKNDTNFKFFKETISSTKIVFNQNGSDSIECDLELELKE